MNKAILMGRLTNEPLVSFIGDSQIKVAKYSLAVDRRKEGTDFMRIVAYGKSADFAESYLHKGMKILVEGRIQTGSYDDKDGKKVYTTDIIVDSQEFCEKKGDAPASAPASVPSMPTDDEGFMAIPDSIQEELPFN